MGSRSARPRPAADRVALVSGYPPTTAMGGGVILRRLLVGLEPRLVVLCSGEVRDQAEALGAPGLLDCEHQLFRAWGAPRFARRLVRAVNFLRTPALAVRLSRHVRDASVLLVPWAGSFGAELFIAGWLAATATGSRTVVYELDDWDAALDGHQARLVRLVGRAVHGRILRRAETVLAISPPLAGALRDRYGVDAQVLASGLDPQTVGAPVAPASGTRRIAFIGAVYGAQADAIARLVRCVGLLPEPVEVVLYTASSPDELARWGITGPRLRVEAPVPTEEVVEVLRQASALFLPFSFRPEQRQTVTTSLPTKTAEYLWSGVPVLVHGPPESVVASLARDEGWGVVIDSEDDRALAAAVEAVLEDGELRASVVAKARATAAHRHDLEEGRRRIRQALQVDERRGGVRARSGPQPVGARTTALTLGRRGQIRLEGRLPLVSAARRDLADRAAQDYASHLPVLLGLQRLQAVRRVLELGAGDFSTGTFLDRTCFADLERLTSVEVDPTWRERVASHLGGDGRLELIGVGHAATRDVVAALDLDEYDLVFVDDSDTAADRAATIDAVVAARPRRPLVVIHDFEVRQYRWASAPLDHRYLFSTFNPMTGVCWNGNGRRRSDLRKLATCIERHREQVALDDRRAWVAALEGGVA